MPILNHSCQNICDWLKLMPWIKVLRNTEVQEKAMFVTYERKKKK